MGLFRKMTSLSTLGAVDFKSDKERTASYTKNTRNHAQAASKEAKKQTRLLQEIAEAAKQPPAPEQSREQWLEEQARRYDAAVAQEAPGLVAPQIAAPVTQEAAAPTVRDVPQPPESPRKPTLLERMEADTQKKKAAAEARKAARGGSILERMEADTEKKKAAAQARKAARKAE